MNPIYFLGTMMLAAGCTEQLVQDCVEDFVRGVCEEKGEHYISSGYGVFQPFEDTYLDVNCFTDDFEQHVVRIYRPALLDSCAEAVR